MGISLPFAILATRPERLLAIRILIRHAIHRVRRRQCHPPTCGPEGARSRAALPVRWAGGPGRLTRGTQRGLRAGGGGSSCYKTGSTTAAHDSPNHGIQTKVNTCGDILNPRSQVGESVLEGQVESTLPESFYRESIALTFKSAGHPRPQSALDSQE